MSWIVSIRSNEVRIVTDSKMPMGPLPEKDRAHSSMRLERHGSCMNGYGQMAASGQLQMTFDGCGTGPTEEIRWSVRGL